MSRCMCDPRLRLAGTRRYNLNFITTLAAASTRGIDLNKWGRSRAKEFFHESTHVFNKWELLFPDFLMLYLRFAAHQLAAWQCSRRESVILRLANGTLKRLDSAVQVPTDGP